MYIIIILLISLICNSYEREVNTLSISKANNHLALQLLQRLYSNSSNVFFSPFSISSAFGMLYVGANSSTADELKEVLGYNYGHMTRDEVIQQFETVFRQIADIDSNNYQLNVANKLVAQKDFIILAEFKDKLRQYFQTTIDSADFRTNAVAVTNDINQWVKQQTHDMIPNLLTEALSTDTVLVLLNAIYFKGMWKTKFLKNKTREEIFYNRGIDSFKTQMMKRNGKFNYTEIEKLDSQLLELPYTGDDISMYILLPKQNNGFKTIQENLNNFEQIEIGIKDLSEVNVDVFIPSFKMVHSYDLEESLEALGTKHLFKDADFSGINGKLDLQVSKVVHKAMIDVNEEGSEASAATAIAMTRESVSPKLIFNANHPFLFFIRDNRNGIILFIGHINKL